MNKSTNSRPTAPVRIRPRDAATLIVVDRTKDAPRVLMGRRRPDQVFLPDTYVFPGGRVEPSDRALARHFRLDGAESACVQQHMRGTPSERRAAALALAALRETFEETGVLLGTSGPDGLDQRDRTWRAHLDAGFLPATGHLTYFARAITPPARPRRYDTRFFIVNAAHIACRSDRADGELLDIGWFSVEEARSLKLPSITRHIFGDLERFLVLPPARQRIEAIPFYAHHHGVLGRNVLLRA